MPIVRGHTDSNSERRAVFCWSKQQALQEPRSLSPDDVSHYSELDEAVHQSHLLVLDVDDLGRVVLEHTRDERRPGPHAALLAFIRLSTHSPSPLCRLLFSSTQTLVTPVQT